MYIHMTPHKPTPTQHGVWGGDQAVTWSTVEGEVVAADWTHCQGENSCQVLIDKSCTHKYMSAIEGARVDDVTHNQLCNYLQQKEQVLLTRSSSKTMRQETRSQIINPCYLYANASVLSKVKGSFNKIYLIRSLLYNDANTLILVYRGCIYGPRE